MRKKTVVMLAVWHGRTPVGSAMLSIFGSQQVDERIILRGQASCRQRRCPQTGAATSLRAGCHSRKWLVAMVCTRSGFSDSHSAPGLLRVRSPLEAREPAAWDAGWAVSPQAYLTDQTLELLPHSATSLSGRERRLCDLGNRPDETGHLAGNGGRDDDLWLAGGGEATIPRAEPDLPLPGNVADRRVQRFEAIVKLSAHPGRHAVCPGPLDQDAPRQGIASLGDSGTPDAAAGGMFAGTRPR